MTRDEAVAAINAGERVYGVLDGGECDGQIVALYTVGSLDREHLRATFTGASSIHIRKA